MLVNFDPIPNDEGETRSHPWSKTAYDENGGFYTDFTHNLDLITEVLEDFKPHEHHPSVQTFYSLLREINCSGSKLESNDCALRQEIISNPDQMFNFSHKLDGRLEFFYRDHKLNCHNDYITWLFRMTSLYLQVKRPNFFNGLVSLSLVPTDFITLPANESAGNRIRLTFNAYGNGDDEVWLSLDNVFGGIRETVERLNLTMTEGLVFP